MYSLKHSLLADENIHDEVIYFLRQQHVAVDSIKERSLRGISDQQIVAIAEKEGKVILTHDADFGRILFTSQQIKTGIIFLRPGHIDYKFTIQTLQAILKHDTEVKIPFMLVAERTGNDIKIRIRQL